MYTANENRYDSLHNDSLYRRLGTSGLLLPSVSLGLWQNFGDSAPYATQREIVLRAFDRGVTHFDLANNYGPPPGQAEENFGQMLAKDLSPYRDEFIISTKAGYRCWPGPYGEGGSRKYLLASLDQSLSRMGVDYVDVFYSHRFDPNTPLAETLGALKAAIDSGKALYAGISSYSAQRTKEAFAIANDIGLKISVHQPSYSILNRWIEQSDKEGNSVISQCRQEGAGIVVFSPLAQGLLTSKYLTGEIPADSRAAQGGSFSSTYVNKANVDALRGLNKIALQRNQSLAQMALAWTLRDSVVTSAIIGARTLEQLDENLDAREQVHFSDDEISMIERLAIDGGLNLWASRSSDL